MVTTSGSGTGFFVLYLVLFILYCVAAWRIFERAGKPGWGIFIPIFNLYLLCKISGRPGWMVIFFFIPLVNVVMGLIIALDIARAFSKGPGFGLGLFFLSFIFVPILGFGSAKYTNPGGLAQ